MASFHPFSTASEILSEKSTTPGAACPTSSFIIPGIGASFQFVKQFGFKIVRHGFAPGFNFAGASILQMVWVHRHKAVLAHFAKPSQMESVAADGVIPKFGINVGLIVG